LEYNTIKSELGVHLLENHEFVMIKLMLLET